MKILYYDCFSGISGDMNLGAMLDLGVTREYLQSELEKLNLKGWKLEISKDQRHGITGTKVTVITDADEDITPHNHHSHNDHHHHDHDDRHDKKIHDHDHEHRNISDIEKIINESTLSEAVKNLSLKIFRRIGEAEAEVHNVPLHKIHFHEVGATDSIIDIVGAAVCYTSLGINRVYVSDIELGSGMVRCEHGLLPVPAPATARIISGYPVHIGGVDFEATTPTGAAIIATLAEPAPNGMKFKILGTGYGVGHKDNPQRPNILRVFIVENEDVASSGHQSYLTECNVDDMNPELSGYLVSKLFERGAQDVFMTPIVMKNGRPAIKISVLCEEEQLKDMKEVLFTESTTIGIRVFPFLKETLQREFTEVQTRFGKVIIKKSFHKGKLVSAKPESDRCAAIASETGIPMKQVIQEIMSQLAKDKIE